MDILLLISLLTLTAYILASRLLPGLQYYFFLSINLKIHNCKEGTTFKDLLDE